MIHRLRLALSRALVRARGTFTPENTSARDRKLRVWLDGQEVQNAYLARTGRNGLVTAYTGAEVHLGEDYEGSFTSRGRVVAYWSW